MCLWPSGFLVTLKSLEKKGHIQKVSARKSRQDRDKTQEQVDPPEGKERNIGEHPCALAEGCYEPLQHGFCKDPKTWDASFLRLEKTKSPPPKITEKY